MMYDENRKENIEHAWHMNKECAARKKPRHARCCMRSLDRKWFVVKKVRASGPMEECEFVGLTDFQRRAGRTS